jgi:hypothetical protein
MTPGLSGSAPRRAVQPKLATSDAQYLRLRPLAISLTPGSRMSARHTCGHNPFSVTRSRRRRAVMRDRGLSLSRAGFSRR